MTDLLAPRPAAVTMAGIRVDLLGESEAVDAILRRARSGSGPALAVASINLDHVHHFGAAAAAPRLSTGRDIEWLNLIDGAPIASQARRLTGTTWPRLAGSDLIGAVLARAEADGLAVGVLGGAPETHARLRDKVAGTHPRLRISGCWAPERSELDDDDASAALARSVAESGTDILIVCLGKPRQEIWIDRFGAATGARSLLAFGAVVDFLAERVRRAPRLVADSGLEWAWRLAREPRRLARRYLLDGPPAYLAVRRSRDRGARP